MRYKYAVGVWAFGSVPDRFCEKGYQQSRSFEEKLIASQSAGVRGVEIHFNGDFNEESIEDTRKMVQAYNLEIAAINCEIFGDRKFSKGALSSLNPLIREEAIDVVRGAAKAAQQLDVKLVNIWPGAEGHDYPFQLNFVESWNHLIDSLKIVIQEFPKQKFSIEYKGREPRGRSAISTVGNSVMITQEINANNLGVTLDFGHALQVRENPAESAVILNRFDKLFHIHMNDNTRDWDDDFMVGSYHVWETLEFFYYLKKIGYEGWISLDITPAREDQIGVVKHSIEVMEQMARLVDEMDEQEIEQILSNHDALAAQRFLYQVLLGIGARG